MFKIIGLTLGLIGALALAAGCGDDDKPAKEDKGTVRIDGGIQLDTSGIPDTYVPQSDTTQVKLDMGPTGSNSGEICQGTCTDPNDTCTGIQGGSTTNGMCLAKCAALGDQCAVPDPATMLSICALGDPNDPSGQKLCAFICEMQAKTYSCPNDTDFDCKVVDPSQPSIKLCVPK
jgi:hypothetical protein